MRRRAGTERGRRNADPNPGTIEGETRSSPGDKNRDFINEGGLDRSAAETGGMKGAAAVVPTVTGRDARRAIEGRRWLTETDRVRQRTRDWCSRGGAGKNSLQHKQIDEEQRNRWPSIPLLPEFSLVHSVKINDAA
jgi:hypothetical protein